MSSDWKAGDKALCVDDGPCPGFEFLGNADIISVGTIYLVEGVIPGYPLGLLLSGVRSGLSISGGYRASRFRKIVPACDRVTVSQEQEAIT